MLHLANQKLKREMQKDAIPSAIDVSDTRDGIPLKSIRNFLINKQLD